MTNITLLSCTLGLLLGTELLPPVACAQVTAPAKTSTENASDTPATLSGRVASAAPEGPGVAQNGATVVIINLATSIRQAAVADAAGRFAIPGLAPGGPYAVQVQQPGFRPQTITNVFLKAGEATDLFVRLNVETVALGTRRADRTALESAVPVDVVDVTALAGTAPPTDLSQLLHYSVAAFNSTRQTAAGGSDHVDPSNLRGLGTDQMLVLVNGKRRHTTALVNLLGNRGVGNVGTDLNTLPSLGIERVEVLRDGAAAQYGSDAIAGVMNINLKSDNHAGSVLASTGITSAGDGLATLLGLNKGFRLGQKGFVNATADADFRDYTTRGYDRQARLSPVFVANNPAAEAAALAAAGKTYADYEQRNGQARTYNVRALLNARAEVSDQLAFYGFGSYNFRRGQAATLWVTPARLPNDVVNLPGFVQGYEPRVGTRIHDAAATVGAVLGRNGANNWTLDLSNTTGYNRMNYDVENSLNISLNTDSPPSFPDAGGFNYLQNVSNVTANRFFDKVLAGTNVALGSEFRLERYEIRRGQEEAEAQYDNYPGEHPQGAQGFSGFGEPSVAEGTRNNVGAFLDVEADVVKRWSVNGAVRYESYANYGQARQDAVIFKATTRLEVAKFLALRGGYNTGFRAPSLQQVFYRQVTQKPEADGLAYAGIFSNQNTIGLAPKSLGAKELTPERSRSVSAGLVLTPTPAFSLTADVYRIDIDDRITLSGFIRPSAAGPAVAQLFKTTRTTSAQFFTNNLNTRTEGLDMVANYRLALGQGQLNAAAAANFTRTTTTEGEVPLALLRLQDPDKPYNSYFDARQVSLIQTGSPASKVLLNLRYTQGKWGAGLQNTYFGEVKYFDNPPADTLNNFGGYLLKFRPRVTTDVLVSYQATRGLNLTLGAQNVFNVKPNTIDEAASNGTPPGGFKNRADFETYYQNLPTNPGRNPSPFPANRDVYPYAPVQMGFNGAFVYLKAVYNLGI